MTENAAQADHRCPRCDGAMEEGFLRDLGDANWSAIPKWIKGKLEVGFWGSAKTLGREAIPVVTMRCVNCGRLESFAKNV